MGIEIVIYCWEIISANGSFNTSFSIRFCADLDWIFKHSISIKLWLLRAQTYLLFFFNIENRETDISQQDTLCQDAKNRSKDCHIFGFKNKPTFLCHNVWHWDEMIEKTLIPSLKYSSIHFVDMSILKFSFLAFSFSLALNFLCFFFLFLIELLNHHLSAKHLHQHIAFEFCYSLLALASHILKT